MPEEAFYRRIAQDLADDIQRGDYKPGDWLPKNADLADQYGVGISTVQRALDRLETLGLITRHQGKGAQVRPD